MNDGQLRAMLAQQSPWRTREGWEQDDADMRAASKLPLDYEPEPLADIRAPGLYVLRGPRRVGKSLELKRSVSRLVRQGVDRKNIFYCSCDGLAAQDLRRLVVSAHSAARTLQGPRYWFLDEVSAVRGWSAVTKQLRDQHTPFREAGVVLTGSSARDLRDATKDLADRRGGAADSDRLLLPMGFRAFCRAIGGFDELPDPSVRPKDFLAPASEQAAYELEPWGTELDNAWQLYLTVGGFPRAVGEFIQHAEVQRGFIDGLWDVIVGDAIRTTSMSETDVSALLNRLVVAIGSPLNASSVAQDVGLRDNERVNDRINDLVTAFLAWRCYRSKRGLPNPAAQRKVYFTDPLVARLAHLRNSAFPEPDPSKLSEQQLGLALNRTVLLDRPSAFIESDRVMYERTETDAEIDFVGDALEVPFESKYQDRPWKRATQTMFARYGRGVLATRTPFHLHDEDGGSPEPVWALPAGILAWLLGR